MFSNSNKFFYIYKIYILKFPCINTYWRLLFMMCLSNNWVLSKPMSTMKSCKFYIGPVVKLQILNFDLIQFSVTHSELWIYYDSKWAFEHNWTESRKNIRTIGANERKLTIATNLCIKRKYNGIEKRCLTTTCPQRIFFW